MLKSGQIYYGWIMMAAVILMSFSSSGARFSFGVFVAPMQFELGWKLSDLTWAASINLLVAGLLRPVAGWLADKYGSRLVALTGLSVAAVALALTSVVRELWQYYLVYGFVLAVGYSFASPVTVTPMVSRWFTKKRTLALSVGSTGSSLGELIIVPMAMLLVGVVGWHLAYQSMAVFILALVLPVAFILIRNQPSDLGLEPLGGPRPPDPVRAGPGGGAFTIRDMVGQADFWRLSFGFFVCGFTMSFASTHFVPFAMEMDFAPMEAATALGSVGLVSIMGSLTAGWLADRTSRKNVLATVYFLRGSAFFVLMYAHHNLAALYLGAFLLGISWTSTNPLTSSIMAERIGVKSLGQIFGWMFMAMPFGSFVGAALGGVFREVSGGYEWSLVLSSTAGLLAAFAVAGVHEPRPRPEQRERTRAPAPVLTQARGSS